MNEIEAKKKVAQAAGELEFTINNFSSTPMSLEKIVRMAWNLRDRAYDARRLDLDDRERILELLRRAKLLAIAHADAETHIESLQLVENDLRRVA